MTPFLHAHAAHADWRVALSLAAAQIDAQLAASTAAPTLGWVYFTDRLAPNAVAMLAELQQRWPGVAWVGAQGVGIAGTGIEYFNEPALSLLLASLPVADFQLFSGAAPLGNFAAHAAQVHADPETPDLAELIAEMSRRTATGYLFGGLASGRGSTLQIANSVLEGGLSGVAFSSDVKLVSRVSQGCQPIGRARSIDNAERNIVIGLDGEPALDALLADLGHADADPRDVLHELRSTLVGLSDPSEEVMSRAGQFGTDTRVRQLIGIDPARRALAIGEAVATGTRLAFCQRNVQAARRDLVRICAEIREEIEPETLPLEHALALQDRADDRTAPPMPGIAGAIYVSCSGRGGAHFGAPSAELEIIRHALGDVPLAGFFANGEIGRNHLYGYTGVLTVFTT